MNLLKKKFFRFSVKFWPFAAIILFVAVFFYPVFINHLIPIPGDLITGAYFPWLDYKWGYAVGVPVKNPITSDVVSIVYPLRSLVVDIYRSGRIPLWNPYELAGFPLVSNFVAAQFSPTMIVYAFFNTINGWTAQIILQPLISSIFFFLMLRHFKLGKIASMFGGIVYAFSGFSMIWLEWNLHALTAAWIPLIILFADKYILEKKAVFGVVLPVALALQIFSGYPQLIIYTFLALAILLIFRKKDINFGTFASLILFIFLGIGLSGIQLIPGAELFLKSQRGSEGLNNDLAYLPYQNLITFFTPDFFGNHSTNNFWGIGNYTNNLGYSGIVVLSVAFLAIVNLWKKKEIKYFVSLIILSLILSLQNPVTDFISTRNFLGLSALSSIRVMVLMNFALAALFAFGLNLLIKEKRKINIFVTIIPLIIVFASAIFLYIETRFGNLPPVKSADFYIALKNSALPFILSFAAFSLIWFREKIYLNFSKKIFIGVVIGLLTVFELFRFGWKFTPFSKPELVFPETPIIKYLENLPKPMRFDPGNVIPMDMWIPYKLESISGYDPVYPRDTARYIAVLNSGKINASVQGRFGRLETLTSPLLNISNNEYALQLKGGETSVQSSLVKVFEDKSVEVLKNIDSLPRAFFVNDWEVDKNPDSVLTKLYGKDYYGGKKIILEDNFSGFLPDNKSGGTAVYREINTTQIEINVQVSGNGFIFISNAYYPGWRAKVDGQEEKIYKADFDFMAIPVTKGDHIIELVYSPASFTIGIWLSAVSILALIGILFFNHKYIIRNAK